MNHPVYTRDRITAISLNTGLPSSYRILPRHYLASPLGTVSADSRFCTRGAGYTILYTSPDFTTAFIETIVRDRFTRQRQRIIRMQEVTEFAWAVIVTKPKTELTVLDLRRNGCALAGIPTDTVNARNHAAGRAFGKIVYAEFADIDGFLYTSRLTGADIYAVFDRGLNKLDLSLSGILQNHPELPKVLAEHRINLIHEAQN